MQSHYITVNNIRLHYVEEGEGEVVILLHGFPEFWYSWRKQIPVLGKNYRVIAPDMRGYNLSDKPKGIANYGIDILAKDIAELIQSLSVGKVNLVGHDWGGAVAWQVATQYPELIKKLAILNMPHPAEMRKAFFKFNLAQLMRSYYIFFFQLPALPEWLIGRNLAKTFARTFNSMSPKKDNYTSTDIEQYVNAYKQKGALTATINYYRAALRNLKAFKALDSLPMPVLLIWGEQDKALGKELSLNTSAYCKQLKVVYDAGSGHFIQHDNPGLVNKNLLDFFAA
jgi:epoxide hydrolase 4